MLLYAVMQKPVLSPRQIVATPMDTVTPAKGVPSQQGCESPQSRRWSP